MSSALYGLKIISLPSLFIFLSVVFARNKISRFPLNSDFHRYWTRSKNKFHIPYRRTTLSRNGVSKESINLYDTWTSHLKSIEDFTTFKFKTKEFFMQKKIPSSILLHVTKVLTISLYHICPYLL